MMVTEFKFLSSNAGLVLVGLALSSTSQLVLYSSVLGATNALAKSLRERPNVESQQAST